MAPGPGARLGAPARWTVQVRLPVSPPSGTRPSPPAPGWLRRPCSSRLRAAGRLLSLRSPRLLAGRAREPRTPSLPPSCVLGRGARLGSRRPAPRGTMGAGRSGAWPRRLENRSGAQSARPARLPGVCPAGGRAIRRPRRPGFVASHARACLASSGRARPAHPRAPAATKRSPAVHPAYISGRLPPNALQQRSPAPQNIHEAAAARGLP